MSAGRASAGRCCKAKDESAGHEALLPDRLPHDGVLALRAALLVKHPFDAAESLCRSSTVGCHRSRRPFDRWGNGAGGWPSNRGSTAAPPRSKSVMTSITGEVRVTTRGQHTDGERDQSGRGVVGHAGGHDRVGVETSERSPAVQPAGSGSRPASGRRASHLLPRPAAAGDRKPPPGPSPGVVYVTFPGSKGGSCPDQRVSQAIQT